MKVVAPDSLSQVDLVAQLEIGLANGRAVLPLRSAIHWILDDQLLHLDGAALVFNLGAGAVDHFDACREFDQVAG